MSATAKREMRRSPPVQQGEERFLDQFVGRLPGVEGGPRKEARDDLKARRREIFRSSAPTC
jgi:hypothetical protein